MRLVGCCSCEKFNTRLVLRKYPETAASISHLLQPTSFTSCRKNKSLLTLSRCISITNIVCRLLAAGFRCPRVSCLEVPCPTVCHPAVCRTRVPCPAVTRPPVPRVPVCDGGPASVDVDQEAPHLLRQLAVVGVESQRRLLAAALLHRDTAVVDGTRWLCDTQTHAYRSSYAYTDLTKVHNTVY